jgi:hypothetical protein
MHALLTLDDWDLPRSCITEEKGIHASRRAIRSQFCGAARLSQETLPPRCRGVSLYTLILSAGGAIKVQLSNPALDKKRNRGSPGDILGRREAGSTAAASAGPAPAIACMASWPGIPPPTRSPGHDVTIALGPSKHPSQRRWIGWFGTLPLPKSSSAQVEASAWPMGSWGYRLSRYCRLGLRWLRQHDRPCCCD